MKELTLNQKELARLQVLNNVLEHRLPMDQAAELLGVTERHAWRILAAYRKEGAAALAHASRGRRPPNAVSDELAAAVVNLVRTRYTGANHTHLTELLQEREGIDLGRQTVHRILTRAGLPSPRRRRPPKHRVRRERMPRAGMLVPAPPATIRGWRSGDRVSSCCWQWTMPPVLSPTLSSGRPRIPGATSY